MNYKIIGKIILLNIDKVILSNTNIACTCTYSPTYIGKDDYIIIEPSAKWKCKAYSKTGEKMKALPFLTVLIDPKEVIFICYLMFGSLGHRDTCRGT